MLLLLSAVLETCTDSWSPDKKKGQPPGQIALWNLSLYFTLLFLCVISHYSGLYINQLHGILFAANMGSLIDCARRKGQWDFFSRTNQLVLISCLEDSTNEVELHHRASCLVYIIHA